jgi:lipoic acid synthetase
VKTGKPVGLDEAEPERVAEAVRQMGVRHAVVTSVNRDELADGGAGIFAATIRAIRQRNPGVTVEVLVPDFRGVSEAAETIIRTRPDIFNHNVETVPRLYGDVRPQAKYSRSLDLLARAAEGGMMTKSGLMLGLGEAISEVVETMSDLRNVRCQILTLGQYLQPTSKHLPVIRYLPLEDFAWLKEKGLEMGFRTVESGPLVRSSYHAERHVVDSDRNIP